MLPVQSLESMGVEGVQRRHKDTYQKLPSTRPKLRRLLWRLRLQTSLQLHHVPSITPYIPGHHCYLFIRLLPSERVNIGSSVVDLSCAPLLLSELLLGVMLDPAAAPVVGSTATSLRALALRLGAIRAHCVHQCPSSPCGEISQRPRTRFPDVTQTFTECTN